VVPISGHHVSSILNIHIKVPEEPVFLPHHDTPGVCLLQQPGINGVVGAAPGIGTNIKCPLDPVRLDIGGYKGASSRKVLVGTEASEFCREAIDSEPTARVKHNATDAKGGVGAVQWHPSGADEGGDKGVEGALGGSGGVGGGPQGCIAEENGGGEEANPPPRGQLNALGGGHTHNGDAIGSYDSGSEDKGAAGARTLTASLPIGHIHGGGHHSGGEKGSILPMKGLNWPCHLPPRYHPPGGYGGGRGVGDEGYIPGYASTLIAPQLVRVNGGSQVHCQHIAVTRTKGEGAPTDIVKPKGEARVALLVLTHQAPPQEHIGGPVGPIKVQPH